MGIVRSVDSTFTVRNSISASYYSDSSDKSLSSLLKITLEQPSPHQLYSLARTCPHLVQLTISFPVQDIKVVAGICAIKSLKHLTFGPRHYIREKSIEVITEGLPGLISLRSQKMRFTDKQAQMIASRLRKLRYLSLNINQITEVGALAIVQSLRYLNVLQLQNNNLHHSNKVGAMIPINLPHLQIIYLNNVVLKSYQPFIQQLPNLRRFRVFSAKSVNGAVYFGLAKGLDECQFRLDNYFNYKIVNRKLANCRSLKGTLMNKMLKQDLQNAATANYVPLINSRFAVNRKEMRNNKLITEKEKKEGN